MTKSDKIIIGIDPGTNILGYGILAVGEHGPEYVDMGVFDLRKLKEPYEKLANIHSGVSELVGTYSPVALAVESPFMGKNAQVILKLGRAQGAAITAATIAGVPVYEYAPRLAKTTITGNGAASKEQVSKMLSGILNIDIDVKFYDATDALAIALCHYYNMTSPIPHSSKRGRSSKSGKSSDWKKFVEENPGRVKK